MANSTKVTAESIWKILGEVGRLNKETAQLRKKNEEVRKENEEVRKKNEEELKEVRKKTEEELKEVRKKTEESFERLQEAQRKTEKSLNKASGNFNSKWGEFMESLIQGDLLKLLGERGIPVNKILREVLLRRSDKTIAMEFDLIAVNGKEVVVVEVKTTLTREKIDVFIDKLKTFKKIFPEYNDKKVYGCVAYLGDHKNSVKESLAHGLFVIQALGEAEGLSAMVNPEDFRPKLF